jgi:hypothetical protein
MPFFVINHDTLVWGHGKPLAHQLVHTRVGFCHAYGKRSDHFVKKPYLFGCKNRAKYILTRIAQ